MEIEKIIRKRIAKNPGYSNCVQIFITEESYAVRNISQIEKYLKHKHFIIAGKEVIDKKIKGIKIIPVGGCIRVTIGWL
jgi:hypothetical protein